MIIDAHGHLGAAPSFFFPDVSLAAIIGLMDHLGIDVLVQAHHASLLASEHRAGYDESIDAYERTGGRVRSLAVFHPHHREESLEWARRSLDHPAFVGLKIHPTMHDCPAEDPLYGPVWELAAERGVPILSHTWEPVEHNPLQAYSFPARFSLWAERYPQVSLVLAHAGGYYRGHRAAIELAQRCGNVSMDLSGDPFLPRLVETLCREVGAERVLFASDLTWADPRSELGRVLGADVPLEAKEKILGDNARRIYKL